MRFYIANFIDCFVNYDLQIQYFIFKDVIKNLYFIFLYFQEYFIFIESIRHFDFVANYLTQHIKYFNLKYSVAIELY